MQSRGRCSYVVGLERVPSEDELRDLGVYLSELGVAGCEVIVLDGATGGQFHENDRVLRWVSRHLRARIEDWTPSGKLDLLRSAGRVARCEKVVIAADDVRWPREAIDEACRALDLRDVVEPAYVPHPLRWWSAIDVAHTLMDRAIRPDGGRQTTIAVRRLRARLFQPVLEAAPRFDAGALPRLRVHRVAPALAPWIRSRPLEAAADFDAPMRTGFFLSILPMLLFFFLAGGPGFAATLSAIGAAGAMLLAFYGRAVLAHALPLRACFLAPLAVIEKSISVYWALAVKLGGGVLAEGEPARANPANERAAG